jgi:hypothetical protein
LQCKCLLLTQSGHNCAYGPAQGLPASKVGTFTQALYDEAKKKSWTVISMKNDWKRIFAVFAFRIIVQHQHHQTRPIAGPGIFKHLPVAIRIAERRVRPPADHQVNALGLAGLVVFQE